MFVQVHDDEIMAGCERDVNRDEQKLARVVPRYCQCQRFTEISVVEAHHSDDTKWFLTSDASRVRLSDPSAMVDSGCHARNGGREGGVAEGCQRHHRAPEAHFRVTGLIPS